MKLLTTALFLLSFSAFTIAQTEPKTGYTNVEFIISKLPEVKKIAEDLEKQKKQYDGVYQQKVKDFQEKYTAYQKTGGGLPEIIKKDKEKELETMQASIQELQQNAEKDLVNKQSQLIQPIYVKVYTAIQQVAEENNYKFIFNTGDGNQMRHILVAPADGDVSELVLKKLGSTAKAEEKAKETTKAEPQKDNAKTSEPKTTKASSTAKKPAKAPVKKKK